MGSEAGDAERGGVEKLTWREFGDAFWLAAVTDRRSPARPPPARAAADRTAGRHREEPTTETPDRPPTADRDPEDIATEVDSTTTGQEPTASDPETVYWPAAPVPSDGADVPVAAASGSLELIRALRGLKRAVPDRRPEHVVLDEDATAEQSVQYGRWLPATTPATTRWLDLTLVVDAGPSMALWDAKVKGFTALLQQLGAFRSIQIRLLDTGDPDAPTVRGGTLGSPARSPAELADRSGRRIMIVITDAVSESWRLGHVSPLLACWAAAMPVALIHLRSQDLWSRGLTVHRARLTVRGQLLPNSRWHTELPDAWLIPEAAMPDGAVPVPILQLDARWLRWWARLITGAGTDPVPATVLLATPSAAKRTPRSDERERKPTPEDRVREFASRASPAAVRLAKLLAAAPVTVDVARLVQRELVPESGTDHLTEVLTSGLVHIFGDGAKRQAWDIAMFDFDQKIRQLLLHGGRRSETVHVVELVAEKFGHKVHDLSRIRDALEFPDSTPQPVLDADNVYYIELERTLLRALSSKSYLSRADQLPDTAKHKTSVPRSVPTTIGGEIMSETTERMDHPATQEQLDLGASPLKVETAAMGPPPPGLSLRLQELPPTGPVPAVWGNIPPRNPLFTGRGDLLDQLGVHLNAGGATAVLPSALHGMGGIGKTQMATEYIYRHLGDYDIVWWIQAAQPPQVRAGLKELAEQLALPGSSEAHTAVPAVREALRIGRPYRRWLIVFDAAESIESIQPFFPTGGPGQILITSRNPNWASVARSLEITVFEREESIALLRKRGQEITDAEADQLAAKLGDLPLAVEQAAAWRAETGMPASEYLRLFDEKVAEILSTSVPVGYEVPMAAAWNVSFDELQNRNPAAHQLLQVCAFFAPEPISRNLFNGVRGISISPDLDVALRDPMQLGRAIRDVNRYGLAKIDHRNNTLQLHRLVQLVLRNRMTPKTKQEMRHGAHMLLANFDPNTPKSSEQWPRYQDVLPHVLSAELTDCNDSWTRQLVINLMQFLYAWGDHEEAAKLAKEALDIWTDRLGETDSQVLEAASNLGHYLWALGRYDEAAELNSRTLERRRQVSDESSEETIIAQLRVAAVMKAQGNFFVARELNEEVYEKASRLYGDEDPITLQTAHDLAVSVRLCGDYRRAFELNRLTSERRAEVLGYSSIDYLNTLSGMYMDRRELGDYPQARDEHEQMARRVEALLGEDKADTLRRYGYLAVARRKAGDHDGALELSKKAIELYRRRYGDDHPNAMECAVGYSIDLRQTRDLDGARTLGEQTYDRYRHNLGEEHPHTLAAAVDLAVTLRVLGDASSAMKLNQKSSAKLRSKLGADHPYAIACAIDLASDLSALGRYDQALQAGAEALDRAERILGAEHPTTLAARLNVTFDLSSTGREDEAKSQYEATLEAYRRKLSEEHPGTISAGEGVRANVDIDPLPS